MAEADGVDLIETFRALTLAQTWDEIRDWLTRHPELLGDDCVQLLGVILGSVKQSHHDTPALQRFYDLLVRAREVGVERAISEGRASGQALSTKVRTILGKLQQTSNGDPRRRIELIEEALPLIDRARNAPLWGALQGMLGAGLSEVAATEVSESDFERAIEAYQQCAAILTRDTHPVEWARTMVELAALFAHRQRGDRVENLDCALNAFREAMSVVADGSTTATMEAESQESLLELAAGSQSDLDKAVKTLRTILRFLS